MILRAVFRSTATLLLILALVGLMIAVPLSTAQAAAPATYEEVLKSVKEATASVKTWSADIETKTTMGGMEIKTRGEMIGYGVRLASDLAMEVMGQLMQVKSVLGDDGIQWTETNTMGQIQVFKLDMNAFGESNEDTSSTTGGSGQGKAQDPSKIFESLGQMNDMTPMGNEVMDGTDAYLFEGTIKDEFEDQIDPSGRRTSMGTFPNKIRVAVGAKDGFVRKLEYINSDGVSFMSMTFSDIKINPSIDERIFQYTVPQGVGVIDATEMVKQGRGGH